MRHTQEKCMKGLLIESYCMRNFNILVFRQEKVIHAWQWQLPYRF